MWYDYISFLLRRNRGVGIGVIITLIVNFVLIYLFSGAIYPIAGIIYTMLSVIVAFVAKDKAYCKKIISILVRSWDTNVIADKTDENVLLLSVAFLIGAMKIGVAIGIFVEVSMILFIALAILIVSGFLIEGYKSGMTLSGAYNIAKIVVKIYQFFTSLADKIMEFIVKVEFSILKIETK